MSMNLGDEVWVGKGKGSGSDPEVDSAAAVILPVPYDLTSSWRKGAHRGPKALLEASAFVELYDIETDSEPWLRGIETAAPILCNGTPELMSSLVRTRVSDVLARGALPIVLGGEHSVTIGAVEATAAASSSNRS